MLREARINRYLLSFFISLLGVHSSLATVFVGHNAITNPNTSVVTSNKPAILRGVQPLVTLTAGAAISRLGQIQSFTPLDLGSYNYQSHGLKTNMLWGGFIGSEVMRSSSWKWVAGLGYYQPNALSTNGSLIQGADPTSDNLYNYRYQTQSQQLLAEGKWYLITKESIQPFLMVGIGATFNKTSHYQTNVPSFLEFTPAFSSHTQTNFTYAVGPGIEVSLTQSFRMGMSYRFTDLGAANTGRAQIDAIPISSTLKQSHIYANQILAQFTFVPWTKD